MDELIRGLQAGRPEAFERLVREYGDRVYRFVKRLAGERPAEDLTQEVFIRVHRSIESYRPEGRFESWLFRVAMNRVRDMVRRARRRPETHDAEAIAREPDRAPAGATESESGSLERLRAAMMELSDADREVVELRHHGGLSFKQMSEVLEEPVGTLLARHHRALKKLKEIMEAAGQAAHGTSRGEVNDDE